MEFKIIKVALIILLSSIFYLNKNLSTINAASTDSINFQGKIVIKNSGTNLNSGTPLCLVSGSSNDICDFQVSYYSDPTAGTLYGTETFNEIEIGDFNGIFNLSFGQGTYTAGSEANFINIFKNNTSVYYQLSFAPSGDSVFSEVFLSSGTRPLIKSVPYAISSSSIIGGFDTVYSDDSDKTLNIDNSSGFTFFSTSTGAINFDLASTGSLTIADAGIPFLNIDAQGGFDYILDSIDNPSFIVNNLGTGQFIVNDDSSDVTPFIIDSEGRVGVSNNDPTALLDIGASGIDRASVRLRTSIGLDPTTNNNGDLWWNGDELYFYNGVSSIDLLSFANGPGFVELGTGIAQINSNNNSLIDITSSGNVTNPLINIEENGPGTPDFLNFIESNNLRFSISNSGQILMNVNGSTQAFNVNYNTNSSISSALTIQNLGSGTIVTALDLSDPEIESAIDLGSNNIQIDAGSSVSVNNSNSEQILQVSDLGTNFGGAVESGAFISRNSYVGEEFMKLNIVNNPNNALAFVWGDFAQFHIREQSNGSGDCQFSTEVDGIGGLGRMEIRDADTTCLAFHGTDSSTTVNRIFSANNLPLVMAKLRPSTITGSNLRVGFSDSSLANNADPTNGIYFTNIGGVWTGVTRNTGVSTNISCTDQTVSITNFATFKIETISTSNVRFYVDNNMSDGLQWTYCGNSNTNIPTAQMTSMIKWSATNVGEYLNIDHFRVWQDDSPVTDSVVSLEEGIITNDTNEPETLQDNSVVYESIPSSFSEQEISETSSTEVLKESHVDLSKMVFEKVEISSEAIIRGSLSVGGNLEITSDLLVRGKIKISSSNFKLIKIEANLVEKFFSFEESYSAAPFIYITQIGSEPISFSIDKKSTEGFTLNLKEAINSDVEFEVLIIESL